ncbi:MAG: 3'-5' exoribonuclease [Nanoarchaeota archaeon]
MDKTFIVVDVETDGPIPKDYSMISFGAVIVDKDLKKTFQAKLRPISKKYQKERLDFLKLTRKETESYEDPKKILIEFVKWIESNAKGKIVFLSDNNGFDWMFMCWYLEHFLGKNPFGYSSTNISSLYKGLSKDFNTDFRSLRKTPHTHNPLDDALGNAEAFLEIMKKLKN